jgi:NAD(P)-dependent dehydrogenase (short-subunit alcohol dehydrogenase family)
MGRELARQLAAEGAHLALCDVQPAPLAGTLGLCTAEAPPGTRITTHACDVASEPSVVAFAREAREQHGEALHLLFNNAGLGGGGSFVTGPREEWDRTFNVCWFGVYYCTRAFLPMLIASDGAHIVNTSSINGFWGSLGPWTPHTAYSAAKFAVKGFSEALINDLRVHAPHVQVSVVMPGHVGTSIALNSGVLHGGPPVQEMTAEQLRPIRERAARMGMPTDGIDDATLKAFVQQRMEDFRDKAPVSAAQAATIMLEGVKAGRWRILVGKDAERLDELVRADPEHAYDPDFGAGEPALGLLQGNPPRRA